MYSIKMLERPGDNASCLCVSPHCIHVGVDMYILNTEVFGYLMKPAHHDHSSLEEQANSFINFKLKTLGK